MLKLIGKLVLGVVGIIAIVAFATHFSPKVNHEIKTDRYIITTFDNKGIIKETHMIDAVYGVKDGVFSCRSVEDGNKREVKFKRLLIENVEN